MQPPYPPHSASLALKHSQAGMELPAHKFDSHRRKPVRGKGICLVSPQETTKLALHPTQNTHPIVLAEE